MTIPDFSGCCDKVTTTLPNLKDIIIKHWHILQTDQSCKETFSVLPIIAFRKGTSLKQIIDTNTIHNNEKLIKTKNNHHTVKCVPCNQHIAFAVSNLFQQQHSKVIKPTKHLKSTMESTAKAALLFIYLLECYICNIQYFGKSETPFNIRLNNHGRDVKNPNAVPACKHFNRHNHDFNNHGNIVYHRTTKKHLHDIN